MPQVERSAMSTMQGMTPGVDADGCIPSLSMKVRCATKTAAYSVLAADSGTHFDNTGAVGSVTFTLPTAALGSGCEYWFANMVEAQDIVVAATAGELVAYNDLSANSITLASLPGTYVHVWSNGTKWLSGVGLSKIDITITVGT
jgi:hypothetical protein